MSDILLLDTANRDWIVRFFLPESISDIDGLQVPETRSLMNTTWRFYEK